MSIGSVPITSSTPLPDLFAYASSEINNLNSGEEFRVKDLFVGYQWKRIPKGNRTKLGGMFFSFAQNRGITQIDILGKTPQNQQCYRKK